MRVQDIYQSNTYKREENPFPYFLSVYEQGTKYIPHEAEKKEIKMEFKINECIKTHIKRFFHSLSLFM